MRASALAEAQQRHGSAGETPADTAADADEGAAMTLVEHLEELRRRALLSLAAVALGTIAGFVFWQRLLDFLLRPLPDIALRLPHHAGQKLIQTHLGEAFLISLQLAIAAGITLASPVILYQGWAFISPAFTRRERRYALPFTVLGATLFVAGLTVGFVVLRYPVDWLINFGDSQFVLLLDAGAYFSFVAYFLLAFGIAFELPLVLTLLGLAGIVSSQVLRRRRMYILFGLWFVSCVITPGADPYSPVIIGVSFTILLEFSVLLLRLLGR